MIRPPFSSEYVVVSIEPETIVDFVPVPGLETTRNIYATIQPLSARELRDLEEGLRSRARFACFTYEALKTAEAGGPPSDRVVVSGVQYEVHGGFNDGVFPGAPFAGHEYILAAPEVV